MSIKWEILAGALAIAASILFVGRYEISAVGYGYDNSTGGTTEETIYRLDRWTGEIEECSLGGQDFAGALTQALDNGHMLFKCGFPKRKR